MTGPAVKKKRFEGLIQFQEPLRQALVCIQAVQGERFATAFQSEFVKARDTRDLSHFLLTSDGSEVGEITSQLEKRHLLLAIEQLEGDATSWKMGLPAPEVKIAAWLDSGDPMSCQQLYLLLAMAVSKKPDFDLKNLKAPGSLEVSFKDSVKESWMSIERRDLFTSFEQDAGKILKAKSQTVVTDGCTVGLVIEGETDLSPEKAFASALQHLRNPSRHLVIINYISGPKSRLQCVYLTPMRLPLKELQSSALKGFVLLRDIKEKVDLPKSVLAS